MSQMTASDARATDGPGVVEQTQELVQEKAQQARGAIAGAVATQVDSRSNQLGSQLGDVTRAFRRTSENLREDGNDGAAKVLDAITERTERLGGYLSATSADDLLHDAEHFGRRSPWLVIAGGMALGLVASRLLKASSSRRFDDLHAQGYSSRYPLAEVRSRRIRPAAGLSMGRTYDGGGASEQVGP